MPNPTLTLFSPMADYAYNVNPIMDPDVPQVIPISNPNPHEVDGRAALVSSPCPSSLEGPPVANVFPDNDGSEHETVRPGVCEGLPAAREPREPEYPNFDTATPSRG